LAQLDKLIQLLHEQRADALRLATGQPASLQTNGTVRPVTRAPLADAQIVSLVREIAPPAVASGITPTASLTFSYAAPSGAVQAEVAPAPEGLVVLLRRSGESTAAAGDPRAREQVDTLLRELSATGASDLHLRAGEPPIFRRHGELVRTDAPALDAGTLEAMVASIMSPTDLAEFRSSGDVDWAYELPEVARFQRGPGPARAVPCRARHPHPGAERR
jgi:twitching motility protein PilT